jgi:hypothetical protein
MDAEDCRSRRCRVLLPWIRRDLTHDEIDEQHVYRMEEDIDDVIAIGTELAPIKIQTIGEEQQLPPPCSEGKYVAEGMNVDELRILYNEARVVEDKLPMQAVES